MSVLLNSTPDIQGKSKRALLAERLRKAADTTVPLSFAQQRLWFLDQLEPNSPLYNVPTIVQMTGALNIEALRQALDTLVSRHESLRTRFVATEGSPAQIVDKSLRLNLALHDLSAHPSAQREGEAQALVRTEVNRPFDLSSGPPIRATLLRLKPDEHWLILNLHHIVSDEWSLKICFRELTELYTAACGQRSAELPALPIQYADYALWQRELLKGDFLDDQIAFWRQQLSGAPPVLELPTDHPRPPVQTFRGAIQSRLLRRELADSLAQLGGRNGATLFMVTLAAFKALLQRYTQQEDIVVGSPIAGRNRVETEPLIGFFVNTLLLRTVVSGDPSFLELLRRVRETTLNAYAHEDLPFEKLVEKLHPERAATHMPFTRIMFVLQNSTLEEMKWPGLTLHFIECETGTAKFDLTMVLQITERGLVAQAEYNRDLFEADSITRLLEHFEILLEGIAQNPSRRLSELPLLGEAERRRMLVEWTNTKTAYPREQCIHELFEAQVERTPDALAAVFGGESVTYQELNHRANQLAFYLKKYSVGPDALVGICLERSVEMIVAMLAVLKAGGAYVPIDASYPRERVSFMLADSETPVLLTQHRLVAGLPRLANVLCLDSDWELIARESRKNLPPAATAENLAYVIYTSGSTGTPKGVAVPHRAVNRLVLNTNYIPLTRDDRVAQVSNASFDAATFEIWGALLNGATVVGITRDVALSPYDFARELREQKITAIFLTTALFNQLAAEIPEAFAGVRTMLFGGESADPKSIARVLKHKPPQRLINVYGPTENTTFSLYYEIKAMPEGANVVPIGRAISNSQCYILDAHLNPTPIGVPGELHVGGDGLARGYWNQPELTEQKFIANPFQPGERIYKTGDLARWLSDGNIEFLGRLDEQVKIRGFRVEPGEIEAVLCRHPAVRESAVTMRRDENGCDRLVAYFVCSGKRVPPFDELLRFLRERLPEYMVPATFVPLEALPLTPNGKVDCKALPEPGNNRPLVEGVATPRDAVELKLTEIWESVLDIKPIGIEDKFFDLGGHSLLAIKLIAQIEKVFSRRLRVATVFQAPTIEQLAAIIREEIQEGSVLAGTSLVEIQSQGTRPPLFLVHGAGGGMFWGYVNLSRHLGTDQPVYGLKSRGLDGSEELASIEEMAAQYVADIRALQPHGPYHLGGYCFGGNVALEMANQLRAQGEEVALLALLNCSPPNSAYDHISWTPTWFGRFGKNLLYWADYVRRWTPAQRREFFRWKKEVIKQRIAGMLKLDSRVPLKVDAGNLVDLSSFPSDQRKLWRTHIGALLQYHPKQYAGRVQLFRSPGHPMLCSFEPDYGWGRLAKGVDISIVPGVHEKILQEPCVRSLAKELKARMDELAVKTEPGRNLRLTSKLEENAAGGLETQPTFPVASPTTAGQRAMTVAQLRASLLDQFEPGQPNYNVPTLLRLTGRLNYRALEQTFSALYRRHEALRAIFPSEDGKSAQIICEPRELQLPVSDFSELPESERERSALAAATSESSKPYVMSRPVLRPRLMRLSENEHLLLILTHAVACDAVSTRILVEELVALYEGFANGHAATLPPLRQRYANALESLQLPPEIEEKQLDYWRQRLKDTPALLDLPADRPRPARQSYAGARQSIALPKQLADAVENLSRQEDCTPFMVLLAAFQTLLSRYTGATDIVVGSNMSIRHRVGLERMIGKFDNLIALRGDASRQPSFREFLRRVCESTRSAQANDALLFERILMELHVERNASYTPIFQVMFDYDEHPLDNREAAGVRFQPVEIHNQTCKLDLKLHLAKSAEGLSGWIEYSSELFDADRIARMAGHFGVLLGAIVRDPSQPMTDLALLPARELQQLLVEWNATEKDYPRDATMAQLFEAQVKRSPDAIALVDGKERFSYSELNTRANQVAHKLRALGVGPGKLVGISVKRSWRMLAGILGVLKAGGAYVPLDPAYPKDRLAFILEDAKAPVLLTEQTLRTLRVPEGTHVVCLDSDWSEIQSQSRENVSIDAKGDDLAYVIYTSGSTGKPKGVAIEHRNAAALIFWAHDVFSREELAGVLASTSICFDLSIFEMFVPLSWGGTVMLAENALALPGLPARAEVTLVNTVPSAIRELLRIKGIPANVRVVNLAGEPLITPLVNQIYGETNVQKVYDLYGPSETTTYSTFTLRKANEPATIGRPLANEQIYLLNSHRQPVPIGIPGEIYIGGAGVAREYLNRPELTAEKFIPNPLAGQKDIPVKAGRFYKTGDLARWRSDGTLEFLGRIDHQVKIRGFRIELGEIESVLRKHAGLRESVVVVREDRPGDKRLAAYVVVKPGADVNVDGLRNFVRESVPEYMVPSAFVFLDALPLTPNGKVDRKALPAPEMERRDDSKEFAAPSSTAEEELLAIWREVLGIDRISATDNFFELGGHSLLAIQVISRVREKLNIELPLSGLFDAPTIQQLARALDSGEWAQNNGPVVPMSLAPRNERLPLSSVQERLWFLDQVMPGGHAYNVPVGLRLKGVLDNFALQRALNEIVRRHEALRTTFANVNGELSQAIAPSMVCEIEVTNLETVAIGEREARAQAWLDAEAQRPFDLATGPLIRVKLARLAATDHVLSVVMHHAISDGWSLTIFFQELEAFYSAFAAGQSAAAVPALPVQYADFSHWQRQWMQGGKLGQELDYWKNKLAGAPARVALPVDHEEPTSGAAGKAWRITVDFSPATAEMLATFSHRENTTPFMVLMAALVIAFEKWTQQRDVVVGTVVAGRTRREIENVIGCFMNFLPIRTQLRGDETGQELIAMVKSEVLSAQGHQDCPFEKIVEAVNPERRQNQNPLYNVALLLQNFPDQLFKGRNLEVIPMRADVEAAQLDLRFEAEFNGGNLSLACEYKTDLFERHTIEHLLASYQNILEALLRNPRAALVDYRITPELENHSSPKKSEPVAAIASEQKIAIAATFTAEPIEESLRYWMKQLELPAEIEFAPFNQVFQQLLDPASALARNSRGVNILLVRIADLGGEGASFEDIEHGAGEFVSTVAAASGRMVVPLLVLLCPAKPEEGTIFEQIEATVARELQKLANVYVITAKELFQMYPVAEYYDARGDELGCVPYTPVFFASLATMIARRFHILQRAPYKVIVLDCDNTLWGGVCGEDGPRGICLDAPRKALQDFMRAQHAAGRLLAICSKNSEEDVREVFAQRLDMPLRHEHFAAWRVNWSPKSENLKSIAKELNLGLDSFIFVDDNPVECAEVEANCPGVLTLQLPENADEIPQFLKHCWAFDVLKVTEEDARRGKMYRESQQRDELRAQSASLADFISGLNLKVQIAPMSSGQLPRVAQLTQRTNQFNLTTIRRTEPEMQRLAADAIILAVSVSDRFGDYGLVGVVIAEPKAEALDIETFLLSCRVLGRGVEHKILAHLGNLALREQKRWVNVHFHPSPKNKPALDFLQSVGADFKQALNGGFVYVFPAEFAAEVAFNPGESGSLQNDAPTPDPTHAASTPPLAGGARLNQCRSIATQLNDPARIYEAMESSMGTRSSAQKDCVAPRTEIERKICALWEKLLHVERVGVTDNFFELGGHSLLAVRLFAELEKITGRKLPLVTLFQAPTVEELARLADDTQNARARSVLVPVRESGSRPPLFLVHGAGGDVLWGYANLAKHMSAEQPVYGIKSRGQIGLDEYENIEDMARFYLQEVRALQPHGPYFLGGYCFGGNVAYEMARKLRAQGEQVAQVLLIDASPSNAGYERMPWWQPAFHYRFARNLFCWFKDFCTLLEPAERRRFIVRKSKVYWRKLVSKFRSARQHNVDLDEVIDINHFPESELRFWQIHLNAVVAHIERPYAGGVTLLRTSGQPIFCSLAEDFCWGKLVSGGVTVKHIPGSHENIFMEPNVRFLAEQIEECLAESQPKSNGSLNSLSHELV